jgi:hypothetical protein
MVVLRPTKLLHQEMDYGIHLKVEDIRANRCLESKMTSAAFAGSPEKRPCEDDRD